MKWAFSANAFTNGKYTTIDAINRIADAGYKGVEILMDYPLIWPFDITQKEINEIKSALKKRSLAISGLNAFTCSGYWLEKDWLKKPPKSNEPPGQKFGPCFCDYEEENRQKRIEYTKRVVDIAVWLGAKDISTCSGYRPLRGTREMAWQNMVGGLKEVVKYAEENETRINIEYEPGCLVGSAVEAQKITEEIDSPNFGLAFDIGHSFVCGENIRESIKKLKNKIHYVHVEDIGLDDKKRPTHYHLIPGQGAIWLDVALQTLKDINYRGWYTVELYTMFKQPIEAVQESIKYLKQLERELSSA